MENKKIIVDVCVAQRWRGQLIVVVSERESHNFVTKHYVTGNH